MMDSDAGNRIYELANKLFPIYRHLMGDEVRQTLRILSDYVSEDSCCAMHIEEVPSGTQVFDWTIPREWVIREAFIENEFGERIIDVKNNNLYVVSYSYPLDCWVTKEELLDYVYVQEDQPDVIPYVTSYYQRRSGFCMKKNMLNSLQNVRYHLVIDSEFKEGTLSYGEYYLEGKSKHEVLFSTYICHPSMANDNCSGMALQAEVVKYVSRLSNREYSYRFLFVPETIGSITYIYKHLDNLRERVIAGFNLSCVGDNGIFSIIHTRSEDTLADRVASHICKNMNWKSEEHSYTDRGSDERQYNSPRVNLPVINISRSLFHDFPEYHTSADNMDYISPEGFAKSFEFVKKIITTLEYNKKYRMAVFCEPQLGKRGLYPTLSQKGNGAEKDLIFQLMGYADGKMDLIEIGEKIGCSADELVESVNILLDAELIEDASRRGN